jgi:regulator of replication initiation timing
VFDLERHSRFLDAKVADAQKKVDEAAQENAVLRADLDAVKKELATSQAALILRIKS